VGETASAEIIAIQLCSYSLYKSKPTFRLCTKARIISIAMEVYSYGKEKAPQSRKVTRRQEPGCEREAAHGLAGEGTPSWGSRRDAAIGPNKKKFNTRKMGVFVFGSRPFPAQIAGMAPVPTRKMVEADGPRHAPPQRDPQSHVSVPISVTEPTELLGLIAASLRLPRDNR
jgi:hypothetical protein